MTPLQVAPFPMRDLVNPAIRATMHELNRTLNTILERELMAGADEADLLEQCHQCQENFYHMLDNIQVPGAYFDFMTNGAYKECYESGIGGWIIKFASEDNPTAAERQLVNAAGDFGVSEALVQTYFIDLPVWLESSYLDGDEVSQYDSDNNFRGKSTEHPILTCAMFQPVVTVEDELGYLPLPGVQTTYEFQPIMLNSGLPLDYEIVEDIDIDSQDWLQAIVDSYGDKFFFRFIAFMKEFRINDLHARNTGYYNIAGDTEVPVLLDWMSNLY